MVSSVTSPIVAKFVRRPLAVGSQYYDQDPVVPDLAHLDRRSVKIRETDLAVNGWDCGE